MADKPLKFIEHEIKNNIVLTNKTPDAFNKETILLGASKVSIGVATDKQVIKVDPITGLNYLGNQVDAQQVYNLSTQRRGCYFYLDLETGRGGTSWYPGSKQVANTTTTVDLKSDLSDDSETLTTLPANEVVELLQEQYDYSKVIWDKIKYNSIEGYIKKVNLTNFRYIDREI